MPSTSPKKRSGSTDSAHGSATKKSKKVKVLVAGGGGFIGSHLAKRLKHDGYHVIVADWAENIYFEQHEFCDEFHNVDLRSQENCDKVTEGVDEVYDLAADMGGMGFILSNHSVILQNNLRIGLNLLQSAAKFRVKRFFFSSSACVYPDYKQEETVIPALKEEDVWPADLRSNAYGFEKLVMEEACRWTAHDHPSMQVRIGRFHNIYGPQGTWKGGREKAPAAFCRKVLTNEKEFPMWGDGEQTRSFCLVDDCVEAVLRLMRSDCTEPINVGSDRLISMNDLAKLIMTFENKKLKLRHIEGPQGVRGRNSDNTLIKKVLGWAPEISLEIGLKKTYFWIKKQIEDEKRAGVDVSKYRGSEIVKSSVEETGESVRG